MFLLGEPFISAEVDYRRERALGGRRIRASLPVRPRRVAWRTHRVGLLRRHTAVGQ
jgi:hypothetical protein